MSGGATMATTSCWRWWREQALQTFTIILLGLFLPLSFLLLARLSTAQSHFNHALAAASVVKSDHLVSFLVLYGNSTILYALVSFVSIAAFVHGLTGGRVTLLQLLLTRQSTTDEPVPVITRHRTGSLYFAWLLLCTLQVCVELGIEFELNGGAISLSDDHGSGFSMQRASKNSVFSSNIALFFVVGLHETMLFWSKSVVKPVVDDTVMGFTSTSTSIKEEMRWPVERVGMGLSFGALWLWRLRDEVDSLAVAGDDYVGLWLYYLTVSIGAIRALKGVIWIGTRMILLFMRSRTSKVRRKSLTTDHHHDPAAAVEEDKV